MAGLGNPEGDPEDVLRAEVATVVAAPVSGRAAKHQVDPSTSHLAGPAVNRTESHSENQGAVRVVDLIASPAADMAAARAVAEAAADQVVALAAGRQAVAVQDPVVQDPVVRDLVARELVARDLVVTSPAAIEASANHACCWRRPQGTHD